MEVFLGILLEEEAFKDLELLRNHHHRSNNKIHQRPVDSFLDKQLAFQDLEALKTILLRHQLAFLQNKELLEALEIKIREQARIQDLVVVDLPTKIITLEVKFLDLVLKINPLQAVLLQTKVQATNLKVEDSVKPCHLLLKTQTKILSHLQPLLHKVSANPCSVVSLQLEEQTSSLVRHSQNQESEI